MRDTIYQWGGVCGNGSCCKKCFSYKAGLHFVQPHLSDTAIDMYEDNEGAKALAENPQGSHRSKHMDVRFHFL